MSAKHSAGERPELLLITDHVRYPGEAFFVSVEAALQGGADAVLAREKQMDSARLLAFCSRLRELTRQYDARLLVHTQADVARAVGADGVHVSSVDIRELPAMRRWLNKPDISLSASCHDAAQLRQASDAGADFALLSPVFPTASHPGEAHLGVERFSELAAASPLPVIALGGITPENRAELANYPVAVISALLGAVNPEQAAGLLSCGRAR
ncbi:MAG TPA: thiamine phosphate synthase [Zetaproteobacteria bacterium]|nr:thiamine phosphate synthase [Zetaproteobacteria bacterium]